MIRCLIVDDEPLARLGLETYLARIGNALLAGTAGSVEGLEALLGEKRVDLVFLDINMPGTSGVDFLRSLAILPKVILVTAYPQFALEGYELNLTDYLVKPVSFERFSKAFKKAEAELLLAQAKEQEARTHLFIRVDGRFEKILFGDILFIESMLNYIKIVTANRTYITHSSLKGIEEELPAGSFLRIHKSYIIALAKVTAIEGGQVFIGHKALPISRTSRDTVYAHIMKK
jgi:DNA-binding LytR/AlgR family response regulator